LGFAVKTAMWLIGQQLGFVGAKEALGYGIIRAVSSEQSAFSLMLHQVPARAKAP
jgi:hypothetical protein